MPCPQPHLTLHHTFHYFDEVLGDRFRAGGRYLDRRWVQHQAEQTLHCARIQSYFQRRARQQYLFRLVQKYHRQCHLRCHRLQWPCQQLHLTIYLAHDYFHEHTRGYYFARR